MSLPIVMMMKNNISIGDKFAYVTGNDSNLLYKIDLLSGNTIGSIGVGLQPKGIFISDGYIYVTCFRSLHKINILTFTYVSYIYISGDPDGISISDGFAYLTCGDDTVTKVDLSTFSVVSSIGVGSQPKGISISDGFAYVVCYLSKRLDKIDLSNFTNIGNIPIGFGYFGDPSGITILNGFAYIGRSFSCYVDKIDLSNFSNIGGVSIGGIACGLAGYNGYIYVIHDHNGGILNKINTTNLSIESVIGIGNMYTKYSPYSIYISNGIAYLACGGSSEVIKIDLQTFTNIGSISVSGYPYSLYIN